MCLHPYSYIKVQYMTKQVKQIFEFFTATTRAVM